MNLYIQVENGKPINHPAFEDNLIQAFGSIPANWKPFKRIPQPSPNAVCTYTLSLDGKTWQDTWTITES